MTDVKSILYYAFGDDSEGEHGNAEDHFVKVRAHGKTQVKVNCYAEGFNVVFIWLKDEVAKDVDKHLRFARETLERCAPGGFVVWSLEKTNAHMKKLYEVYE